MLQINRSPTSGEVKICLGSVGGCTSDVIRILNAAVAIHLMHAGVSAWAVLHLPRYIHQKALSRHASCQTACQSLLQKMRVTKFSWCKRRSLGVHTGRKERPPCGYAQAYPSLFLFPLWLVFPLLRKRKKLRRESGMLCLVRVLTLLSA